jgi:iron only hydrogenase large subunit-like protein
MNQSLRPIIKIVEENCVNCHHCIAVCPAKMCNDGSGNIVSVNSNLCIGCGECIDACSHNARIGIDDADEFFSDLKKGEKIIAIVAPAVASNFSNKYLELNGFLASLGVSAFFDVSFGAELTVKSYLEYQKNNNPKCIIAQPCPVLITFIEIYRPNLIPLLAPADSPMAHTMKMIKHFYKQYSGYKIAAISPCYAKKREFDEIKIGDYNVTFKSIQEWIDKNKIDLSSFPKKEFENPPAERAVLFSTPGGLMRTAARYSPNISEATRKIEGQPEIFDYLAHLDNAIQQGKAPIHSLIDCLNCKMGCNAGPGTMNRGKHIDIVEREIEKRNIMMQGKYISKNIFKSKRAAQKNIDKVINKYWKPDLYKRSYVDHSDIFNNFFRKPEQSEIDDIYKKMHKENSKDILNCGSCGYNSCERMAVAILNKLNRPENCRHYMSVEVDLLHQSHKNEINLAVTSISEQSSIRLQKNIENMKILADGSTEMASCITESSTSIEQMVANIQEINKTLEKNADSVLQLDKASGIGKEGITEIVLLITEISKKSESLEDASKVIKELAARTNLLAMNAAIEASHAGTFGQGFAVVANEIRKLAENSAKQASSISKALEDIKNKIDKTVKTSQISQSQFEQVVSLTEKVRKEEMIIKNAVTEQSSGGKQVLTAFSEINKITARVKDDSISLLDSSYEILSDIRALSGINEKKSEK